MRIFITRFKKSAAKVIVGLINAHASAKEAVLRKINEKLFQANNANLM